MDDRLDKARNRVDLCLDGYIEALQSRSLGCHRADAGDDTGNVVTANGRDEVPYRG